MNNYTQKSGHRGWFHRGRALVVVGLILGTAPAWAADSGDFEVPKALQNALGWKEAQAGNEHSYQDGSIFMVTSAPDQWPAAREHAAAWLAGAPTVEDNPSEHLLRRLALVEALILSATAPEAVAALRDERATLIKQAAALRDARSDEESDWQKKGAAEQLQQLVKVLGTWLADSPEDRVRVFREELEALRPATRAQIAARYGGEARLAELIVLVEEQSRLEAAHRAALQDKLSPPAERKKAVRKAAGSLAYFHGFHAQDSDLQRALQDTDVMAMTGADAPMDYRNVSIPDLVAWVGEAQAETLLVEAYGLPVTVYLDAGSRTGALARRLLVEGKLKPERLPWSLVEWRGSLVDHEAAQELVALYDVLKTQYPELTAKGSPGEDWDRKSGLATLAYALAITGRMDEATEMLAAAGPGGSGLPYRAQVTHEAAAAAWDLVARASGTGEIEEGWEKLVSLAGPAKRSEALTAFATERADAAERDSENAKVWRVRQGWARVGEGKIDDGLAILMPALEVRPEVGEERWSREWMAGAARLLRLAQATERTALAKTWSDRLASDFNTPTGLVWSESELFDAFATKELADGNYDRLETLLRGRLAVKPAKTKGHDFEDEMIVRRQVDRPRITLQLVDVLGRQGRHADVVALLAESPDWNATDVVQMSSHTGGRDWRSLALITAEALRALGREDEAVKVLEAALIADPGEDALYALYTSMQGERAMPFLEKMWAADRFQERPLIWLASLQLAAGDVALAETTIKQAIATDPSDGEQGKGDRMRAYAVLREVALKKGDAEQAEFLAGVLAAIRRSEDADDLAQAGLVSQAIEEYKLALESFSDAYCIQSRLARQLAEENRMAEAAEHYKRAFELMPDSFGRVESHCFGCEKAFAGEDAQSIAEQVFTEMAAKPDAKAQVYYLLGYLRMEQGRWDEAATHFSKAVEKDPDYLNAWSKLASVLPNTARPRSELDRATFRLIALDPSGRRGSADVGAVRDLSALWKAYADAKDQALPVPDAVYPLGDKAEKKKERAMHGLHGMNDRGGDKTPAKRLAQHDVLSELTQTMDNLYQWRTSRY